MNYISLYRKYRPETFDQIIGQDHIVRTLTNQIKSDSIGHAYLFTGTRGTGKTTAAKIFARAVNCTEPVKGSPCGKCQVCIELNEPNNLDILEIDAASNNGVDEIREIRDKVKYPPVSGRYKVYIIDEVHMLTPGAYNALLKTLEEPPAHIIFILATTEVHKLPQTILSRCMRFDFRLIPAELIENLIIKIYNEMKKPFEKEAITAIAAAGEGSVRDALSVADMCLSFREGELTYKDVQEITGASSPELMLEMIDCVLSNDLNRLFVIIEDTARHGKNFSLLARDISHTLRNLIYIKNSDRADEILKLPEDIYLKEKAVADRYDSIRILTALESLCKLEGTMRYSIQPKIAFEATMIRAAVTGNELNEDALAKIKYLEDEVKRLNIEIENAKFKPRADKLEKEEKTLEPVIIKESDKAEPDIIKQAEVETAPPEGTEEIPELRELPEYNEPMEAYQQEMFVDINQGVIPESLELTEEKAVFGSVRHINKGEAAAKEIIGKVIGDLRKRELYHLHGIFGYNDVKVWIKDGKYYIETQDDYGFNQLTDAENNKIIVKLLMKYCDGSYDKLVILPPKAQTDMNKSVEVIKDLFDADILTIRK